MTLPCAPPSIRIRAAWPLTLHTKVRRVVLAWSTVNVETPTPFCRSLRRLLLVMTGSGIESSAGARVGMSSGAGRTVEAGEKITGAVLTGAVVEENNEGGGGGKRACGGRQGEGASVSGTEGLLKIEN